MVVRHIDFSDKVNRAARTVSVAAGSSEFSASTRREKRQARNWKPIVVARSVNNPYQCHCAEVSRGLVNLCSAHMLSNYLPQSNH